MLLDKYLEDRDRMKSDIMLINLFLSEFFELEKYIRFFIDKYKEDFRVSFQSDKIRKPSLNFDVVCYLDNNKELRVRFEIKKNSKAYVFLDTDVKDSVSSQREYKEIYQHLDVLNSLGYGELDLLEAVDAASMNFSDALLDKACGFKRVITFL